MTDQVAPDRLVATLARIARAVAEREAAARHAKLGGVDRPKRGGGAA